MAIPSLSDLQLSLARLRKNEKDESLRQQFLSNGYLYFVESGIQCWWCKHESMSAAAEMLHLFALQPNESTEKYKRALAERLVKCEKCISSYYASKVMLRKRYSMIYEEPAIETVFQTIEDWDATRIVSALANISIDDNQAGRMAVIDALASAANILFHKDAEEAVCKYIEACVDSGLWLDTRTVLLPGVVVLSFSTIQRVNGWARQTLKHATKKDAHVLPELLWPGLNGIFQELAASIPTISGLQLSSTELITKLKPTEFLFSTTSAWHGVRAVFSKISTACKQELAEHFDGLILLVCQCLIEATGSEFLDALRVFSDIIGASETQEVWPRIEKVLRITPMDFAERIIKRHELRSILCDNSARGVEINDDTLTLYSRQLRPIRDWITPFVGSLDLPKDLPTVEVLLEELIPRIQADTQVQPVFAAAAFHMGIAIIVHCLKLPPSNKFLDENRRFLLTAFLNQNVGRFIEVVQGQSPMSQCEFLISATEGLIETMIFDDLAWTLKAISEISEAAQSICEDPHLKEQYSLELGNKVPVLTHFSALWIGVLQDPKNTIVFKKALHAVSYLLLFDPLPHTLTVWLPTKWAAAYKRFENMRGSLVVLLKRSLELLAGSLEGVDGESRRDFEADILPSLLRLLVSPAKAVHSTVLQVLRISSLDSHDDNGDIDVSIEISSGRGNGVLELTDSERDLACIELYERYHEKFLNELAKIVHDCKILVNYSRPAFSCCSNSALFTQSLLSLVGGSSSSKRSEALAKLFYGFCGLLGSILRENTANVGLSDDTSIYAGAVPTVFTTVYHMLNSAEFADYVRMAKNSRVVNEDEAMDALSVCVSQMLIYLQSNDPLGVSARIIRTFGLIANGLAAISGASILYPAQLVQDLISGDSGQLSGDQQRLLKTITSRPAWQPRLAAVSETKPVQINIDEIEAFAAMDSFDLSDVLDDVTIVSEVNSSNASVSAVAPIREKPVTTKTSPPSKNDIVVMVEPKDDTRSHPQPCFSSHSQKPTSRPVLLDTSVDLTEDISPKEDTREIYFTADDASLSLRRKQSSMDYWLARANSHKTGQLVDKTRHAGGSRAVTHPSSSSARTAGRNSKASGGLVSQMRSSFVQERKAIAPSKGILPKIPKQVVKASRAMPSVPTDMWAASRFGSSNDPYAYALAPIQVRDASREAILEREHEREKSNNMTEDSTGTRLRSLALSDSSDTSSSESESENACGERRRKGGLAGLIDIGRTSTKGPPRRTMKMMPFGEILAGSIRARDGSITFHDAQTREKELAEHRAKMRLLPNMAALHKHILGWQYEHTGDMPPSILAESLQTIPEQFDSSEKYIAMFEPLFLLECWAQFQRAKEETAHSEMSEAQLQSHMSENNFQEVTFSMPSADAQLVGEGDVLVFVEHQSREKQLAQAGRSSGRFGTRKTFLAMVKKRLFGRDVAQVVVRMHFEGARIAEHLSKLVLNSMWEFFKLLSLTPIHREYAALQSLPYLDEHLVQEILRPRPLLNKALSTLEVRKCMQTHSLNQPQAEAVVTAMQREHGFTLIQGPPGTGKTKTILGLTGALLSQDKDAARTANNKLLICAPSNAAVDEIVKRLKSGIRDSRGVTFKPRVVRVGQSDHISSTVRDTTLDFLMEQALNANSGSLSANDDISEAQSGLLMDIVRGDGSGDSAATQALGAKETRKSALGQQRTLRAQLDEINVEIRELDSQMQRTDPSSTAALREMREKFHSVKQRKQRVCQQLEQERARAREASKAMDERKQRVRMQILQSTDILCCTLSGSGHDMLTSLKCAFDTVIIDEAAQSIELSCLIPLKYECNRCVLVGDPLQLPPTVFSQSATKHGYNKSLFVRVQQNAPESVSLLSIQYRMHPEISALPSRLFYNSRLKDGPEMAAKQCAPWHRNERYPPFVFLNIQSGREQKGALHSVFNMQEVEAAVQLVFGLCQDYPKLSWKQRIGVITPYKQQLRKLVEAFRKHFGPSATDAIECNTVDGFQGQEKDIIIFSCVRAGEAGVGFLADRRRMNVGLTRARKSLFVLGNAKMLGGSPLWKSLIDDANTRGLLKNSTLPLFGRAAPLSAKLTNLFKDSSQDATQSAPDGEGDRAEFILEDLDEAALTKFSNSMQQLSPQRQPGSSFTKLDVNDTIDVDSAAGGSQKITAARPIHPALAEVRNARKRSCSSEGSQLDGNALKANLANTQLSDDSGAEQTKRQARLPADNVLQAADVKLKAPLPPPLPISIPQHRPHVPVQPRTNARPPLPSAKLLAKPVSTTANTREKQRNALFIPRKRPVRRSAGPSRAESPSISGASSAHGTSSVIDQVSQKPPTIESSHSRSISPPPPPPSEPPPPPPPLSPLYSPPPLKSSASSGHVHKRHRRDDSRSSERERSSNNQSSAPPPVASRPKVKKQVRKRRGGLFRPSMDAGHGAGRRRNRERGGDVDCEDLISEMLSR